MAERNRRQIADNAARAATYRPPQPLPTWHILTRWLGELNRNSHGPSAVYLALDVYQPTGNQWMLTLEPGGLPHADWSEEAPGDGRPFDAAGCARRLLSHARDGGFK